MRALTSWETKLPRRAQRPPRVLVPKTAVIRSDGSTLFCRQREQGGTAINTSGEEAGEFYYVLED